MDNPRDRARRDPAEDRDHWLERVEALLVYNRVHRQTLATAAHEDELRLLGPDRHTYVIWWDFHAVTEAMDAATKTGGLPEIEFGGPDESATVWVKVFKVIDLPESSSSSQDRPHGQSPVKRVLSHVVWYHLDLARMLAFDATFDYRRPPDDPSAPQPIPSTRDLMGLSSATLSDEALAKEEKRRGSSGGAPSA